MTSRPMQRVHQILSALQQKSALAKTAIILAGYLLAFALALGLVALRVAMTSNPEQHSSGMEAFGDMLLFLAFFGAFATIPTMLALYFVRPTQRNDD